MFAQLSDLERNTILGYYKNKTEYSADYENIGKLIQTSDPDMQKKFSQCAKAMMDIKIATEIKGYARMYDIYAYVYKEFKFSNSSTLAYLEKLIPSFSYNPFLYYQFTVDHTKIGSNEEEKNIYFLENKNISAPSCAEVYINTLKKSDLIDPDKISLVDNFHVLYPEEMKNLEKSITNAGLIDVTIESSIVQYFDYMLRNYILNELRNNLDSRKYSAENDLVFCDRMMSSEIQKFKDNQSKTNNADRFSGSWYFKDGAGDGYYIWNFSSSGSSVTGYVDCTSTNKLDNHSLSEIILMSDGSINGKWSGPYDNKQGNKGKRFGTFIAWVQIGNTSNDDVITIEVFEDAKSDFFAGTNWGKATATHKK